MSRGVTIAGILDILLPTANRLQRDGLKGKPFERTKASLHRTDGRRCWPKDWRMTEDSQPDSHTCMRILAVKISDYNSSTQWNRVCQTRSPQLQERNDREFRGILVSQSPMNAIANDGNGRWNHI